MKRFLLAAAVLSVIACTKTEGPPVGVRRNALADSADQVLFGTRFTVNDLGVRRADVEGDTAYFFNDNTRMIIRPARVVFFSANGTKDGIMTADQGIYDTRLASLEGYGHVVVVTLDGKRLETPYAKFDQRINQISSDSTFLLTEPGRNLRGKGFRSDADLNSFSVTTLYSSKAGTVTLPP